MTAHYLTQDTFPLKPGDTVLVHAAAGGAGFALTQVARLRGATVIATVGSDAKAEIARQAGATEVIVYTRQDFEAEVKRLTGGRGVDVVYDPVGGDISVESLRCVRFGARFLLVGWAATPFVADGKGRRGAPRANQLPTNLIMMKGLDLLGCPTVIATSKDPSLRAPRLAQILAWAEAGQIVPFVSHAFPLDRFQEAMRAKWNGDVIGGCVLHP
jgi:NADPH2:quinone reductase